MVAISTSPKIASNPAQSVGSQRTQSEEQFQRNRKDMDIKAIREGQIAEAQAGTRINVAV